MIRRVRLAIGLLVQALRLRRLIDYRGLRVIRRSRVLTFDDSWYSTDVPDDAVYELGALKFDLTSAADYAKW